MYFIQHQKIFTPGTHNMALYRLPIEGAFNNYLDNKGWVGGLKFAIFVRVYHIKNVHEG